MQSLSVPINITILLSVTVSTLIFGLSGFYAQSTNHDHDNDSYSKSKENENKDSTSKQIKKTIITCKNN